MTKYKYNTKWIIAFTEGYSITRNLQEKKNSSSLTNYWIIDKEMPIHHNKQDSVVLYINGNAYPIITNGLIGPMDSLSFIDSVRKFDIPLRINWTITVRWFSSRSKTDPSEILCDDLIAGKERSLLYLHPGNVSWGCVTVCRNNTLSPEKREQEWHIIHNVISHTKTEKVPDNRGLHKYFPGKQIKFGILKVQDRWKINISSAFYFYGIAILVH